MAILINRSRERGGRGGRLPLPHTPGAGGRELPREPSARAQPLSLRGTVPGGAGRTLAGLVPGGPGGGGRVRESPALPCPRLGVGDAQDSLQARPVLGRGEALFLKEAECSRRSPPDSAPGIRLLGARCPRTHGSCCLQAASRAAPSAWGAARWILRPAGRRTGGALRTGWARAGRRSPNSPVQSSDAR